MKMTQASDLELLSILLWQRGRRDNQQILV
jgi:hypothetical protein